MPHPNTHLLVLEEAVKPANLNLDKYRNYAALGTFGPDIFYLLGRFQGFGFNRQYPHEYGRNLSDMLHWHNPLDFYCSMLDGIKEEKDPEIKQKKSNFAIGYYSHVVTDAIMHPMIYMRTNDHWEIHPKSTYTEHKALEARIDTYLLRTKRNNDPYVYEFEKKIVCHPDGSKRTLDSGIHNLFAQNMKKVYGNWINEHPDLFNGVAFNAHHVVRDAYKDVISAFRTLSVVSRRLPEGWFVLEPRKYLDAKEFAQLTGDSVWNKEVKGCELKYNVDELFNFSVSAMAEVIRHSEAFLRSDFQSSRDFFKKNSKHVLFLDHNYNFDTGLRTTQNSRLERDDVIKIFEMSLPKLRENYGRLESLK